MSNYRYAGIETYDINNGKGFGVTLFVQGCPHHCPGCHNPQTWDFNGGNILSADVINKVNSVCGNENIKRLTISGGEPFANFEVTYSIASMFKNNYPNKQLWVYTGYTYEELLEMPNVIPLLSIIDVLVDGEYIQEERDLSLAFCGSKNQRVIDLKATNDTGEIILLDV